MNTKGRLIFFCGKMAAGKSTKAKEVALESAAILLSEDEWLTAIFPNEINSIEDYLRYTSRLKPLLKEHVQKLLNAGVSVVMDFPGNTVSQRGWFKGIIDEYAFCHTLIYLESNDEQCLKQLEQRQKSHPERAQFDTKEVFKQVTQYFQEPTAEEGFNIEVVKR